jgi:hypothetical protein
MELSFLWSVSFTNYHDIVDMLPAVTGLNVCLFKCFQLDTNSEPETRENGLLLRRLQC